MKYRCPYCGKPGISFVGKIDFLPPFICAKCDYCQELSRCYGRWGGHIGHRLVQFALAVALGGFWIWAACLPGEILSRSDPGLFAVYIWLPLLVWAVLAGGFNWLFCYLDKRDEADGISDPTFRFTMESSLRLWPRVRVGEIYVFRFPERKAKEDGPYIVGMITKAEKSGDQKVVTVRVIKEYLMEAPTAKEAVVLHTLGKLTVRGVVSRTYRLQSEKE